MAGSAKRERQLAREHYERQQARRAATTARRHRWQQVTAAVVAVLLVIGGIVGLTALVGGDDDSTVAANPTTSASSSPSAPAGEAGDCTYAESADKAAKKVSVPTYDEKTAKQPFTATLTTNRGDIVIEMASAKAPCTTNSFRHLATEGYYDGSPCHRLTTGGIFVLQCGDPTGSGGGGPGYQFGIENAPADGNYPAGTVAMARTADPNSNGSQFFLVYKDTQLPTEGGGYTIFGRVTKGLDLVAKVAKAGSDDSNGTGDGKPKQKVTIESVQIGKA